VRKRGGGRATVAALRWVAREGSGVESTRQFDPRFDPAFQRGFEGAVSAPPEESTPVEVPPQVVSRASPVDAPPPLRANPWVPALWVVAAALIVGGVAGQTIAEVITAGPTAETPLVEYVIPGLLRALSPWLLVAGLLAGIGVMFLHAVRWRE
jgi:hypothetical protein